MGRTATTSCKLLSKGVSGMIEGLECTSAHLKSRPAARVKGFHCIFDMGNEMKEEERAGR